MAVLLALLLTYLDLGFIDKSAFDSAVGCASDSTLGLATALVLGFIALPLRQTSFLSMARLFLHLASSAPAADLIINPTLGFIDKPRLLTLLLNLLVTRVIDKPLLLVLLLTPLVTRSDH